jgi:uncharacterized protein YjiS (DUF1127 family)
MARSGGIAPFLTTLQPNATTSLMELPMTPIIISRARTSQRQTALFGRLAGRIQAYTARRRARRALLDLDEHLRRDLGLIASDERPIATSAWLRRW